jgi:hypothetical protein
MGPGPHQASSPVSTGGFSPGIKGEECGAQEMSPSDGDVNNHGVYLHFPVRL